MQIAHWIRALLAVLGFAAVVPSVSCEHFNNTLVSRIRRSPRKHRYLHEGWYESYYNHSIPLRDPGKFRMPRENQMLLRQESRKNGSDCCPSVLEMIEPDGGRNQNGYYVELFQNGDYRQRFYELSCHAEILDKPCRFMDKKLHDHSKCVQKYSYTYALVKDPDPGRHHHQKPNFPSFPAPAGPEGTTWTLDYIRVRSGCGCVVMSNKKKRDRQKSRKHRNDDVNR